MKCKTNVPRRIQVALTSNAFSKIHGDQGKSSIMQPKLIILNNYVHSQYLVMVFSIFT